MELANVKQLEHFAIYCFNRCGKQRHKDGVKNMSGISGRHIYPHLLQDKGEAITVLSSLHRGGGGGGDPFLHQHLANPSQCGGTMHHHHGFSSSSRVR